MSSPLVKTCLSRCLKLLTATVAMLFLAGCSGTMFNAYPAKVSPVLRGLANGTPLAADHLLTEESNGSDRILYNLERGRVAQILGNQDVSSKAFNNSIEAMTAMDLKAIISASAVAENIGAILINDNAISYEGEGYERVLLHHYQALNFLNKNDLEGAAVEVRRANAEQTSALQRFESEVDKAQEEAARRHISKGQAAVLTSYAKMDEAAGKVKNSFQNAYTFYLSGFIYELTDQANDAYIDYKKALEIYPENRYLQGDVIRLATALRMDEDLAELRQRFGGDTEAIAADADSGELLLLFEDGLVPQKQEVGIALPLPEAGIVKIAFPIYPERRVPLTPLTVSADNWEIGITEPICDIRALAIKALKEKAPVIATRQILRAIAKGASRHAAKKQLGDIGDIGMTIINLATEHADLRSWLTLPANAQILRATLPAGIRRISMHDEWGGIAYADVNIPPKGKALLQLIRVGKHFYSNSVSFPSRLPQTAAGGS